MSFDPDLKEKEKDPNIKRIIIVESVKTGNKRENKKEKEIEVNSINNALMYIKKEKKERVEVETWGLNDADLSFEKQLITLKNLFDNNNNNSSSNSKDKYIQRIINHIKTKIHSYRHQDTLKKKYNETEFINLEYVIQLLIDCELKCHYCACETFLLYEIVREMKQWSLDRINNDIGHNKGNLVMACLECNLKRRRTNKDSFFITKNLKIFREGIDIRKE
jgi:hypothetical protein